MHPVGVDGLDGLQVCASEGPGVEAGICLAAFGAREITGLFFPVWSLRAECSPQPQTYLHQKLVPWDPLHRLDHEVRQSLLFLVLTHALLKPKTKWRESPCEDNISGREAPRKSLQLSSGAEADTLASTMVLWSRAPEMLHS